MSRETQEKSGVELIRELDKLIAEGQWDGSIFYQTVGKKLRDFSEQVKKDLNIDDTLPVTPTDILESLKQKSGLIEVYISVYCTEGRNINKWESVLSTLPKQIVSRPIYKRQKDIKGLIDAKENPVNDAYVFAYVTDMDILKPSFHEKMLLDRFGHELVRLKENALKLDNITKFVHLTGEYAFIKNKLTRLS